MDKFKPVRKVKSEKQKQQERSRKVILYNPQDIIDYTFKMKSIVELVEAKAPFLYLRYNDGEWRATLGPEVWNVHNKNGNVDHHDFFEGMMNELRYVLKDISKLDSHNHNIFVGLHGTWDQKEIQQYVVDNNLKDTVHWVGTILAEEGIMDLSFLDYLNLIKDNKDICKVLIAKPELAPMVDKLNIDHHVQVSLVNSYLNFQEYFDKCKRICDAESRPILFMSSMGPSSNILGYLLYEYKRDIMYFNTGSGFDPFIRSNIRGYMRKIEFIHWFQEAYKNYIC